jgi:3-hydroxyisobutyrate dehydrogenase
MKIAILGTGAMGSAMGEAILNAGHELIVYNRTAEKTKFLEEKGAKAVTHAFEAISQADVSIFVMVNGLTVKNTLLNDNTLAFVKNKYIINAATSSVEDIYELSEAVSKHGGKFAEVSMMQAVPDDLRAATGTLNLGCNKKDEQFLLDILSTFSGNINVIGEIGDSAKLDSVSLVGSMMSLTKIAYSVALAQKLGIKPEVYEPMINMMEPMGEQYTSKMVAHNYSEVIGSVEGTISLMDTVLNLVESQDLPTELIVEMKKLFEKTAEIGYSQKDGSAVIEVLLNNN